MAIIKPNNNTISAITALPAAIPTGKVLQVVQGTHGTEDNFANTSYQASETDVDITVMFGYSIPPPADISPSTAVK